MANNSKNLIPNSERTPEELREIARKGGIASGEARRKKKIYKEVFESILDDTYTKNNGEEVSGYEATALKVFEQAMQGNIKAFAMIRDTIGQAPVQKIQTSEVDPDIVKEVEKMMDEESERFSDEQSE